jgi:hypothetical protein
MSCNVSKNESSRNRQRRRSFVDRSVQTVRSKSVWPGKNVLKPKSKSDRNEKKRRSLKD